ncbi:class I SAM-dependent methyltransferase [Pseudonocardia spinosispora]|uniref:class I SAM-dependent methyltransferase n=1 Tax=Pseudonocardia spinosispora TaxID=103441 RepID=UPI001FDFFFB8|nr:class I SAM-dependent methyltransferase [Pseudonocardia spinosispora]
MYDAVRMDNASRLPTFDNAYQRRSAPWVIGEPQPAVLELERAGLITGRVLDIGCGAGEHTIHLTRLGYDVLGVDFAPTALEVARENATTQGVPARFETADALSLIGLSGFDTVIDSALFHVFATEEQQRYARTLHGVCAPGARVHVLALSDRTPGFGPRISDAAIRAAFTEPLWALDQLEPDIYRADGSPEDRAQLGLPAEGLVDMTAWLATARRLDNSE